MGPLVSLEVRALRVNLIAVGKVAAMDTTTVGGHLAILEARVINNLGGKVHFNNGLKKVNFISHFIT